LSALDVAVIRGEWPFVVAALEETYCRESGVREGCPPLRNTVGYLVVCLRAFERLATSRFVQLELDRRALDYAAAREVRWIFANSHGVHSWPVYLGKCWANLVIQRPERLRQARNVVLDVPDMRPSYLPRKGDSDNAEVRRGERARACALARQARAEMARQDV